MINLEIIQNQVSECTICAEHLPLGPRPVWSGGVNSKIVIVGQAPGRIVHNTGVPWNDKSGDRLRTWMGIDKDFFYDTNKVSLIPMGFCYPGTGANGDLPPRKECAPLWHDHILNEIKEIKLIILAGQYAQKYYLAKSRKRNLTLTVMNYAEYLPLYLPIPHPSGRNNIWLKKNPWFEEEVIPHLRHVVASIK